MTDRQQQVTLIEDEDVAFLRRLATSLCRNESAAEDLVQDTLVQALRPQDSAPRHRRAWLATVMRRLAMKGFRTEAHRRAREIDHQAELSSRAARRADESIDRDHAAARLAAALEGLTEEHRELLALRFDEELSFADIGARVGLTPEAARSRVRRALDELRRRLDGAYDGERDRWLAGLSMFLGPRKDVAPRAAGMGGWLVLLAVPVVAGLFFLLRGSSAPADPSVGEQDEIAAVEEPEAETPTSRASERAPVSAPEDVETTAEPGEASAEEPVRLLVMDGTTPHAASVYWMRAIDDVPTMIGEVTGGQAFTLQEEHKRGFVFARSGLEKISPVIDLETREGLKEAGSSIPLGLLPVKAFLPGRVLDAEAKPVAGARVQAFIVDERFPVPVPSMHWSYRGPSTVWVSGEDGSFSIPLIHDASASVVRAEHDGKGRGFGIPDVPGEEMVVSLSEDEDVPWNDAKMRGRIVTQDRWRGTDSIYWISGAAQGFGRVDVEPSGHFVLEGLPPGWIVLCFKENGVFESPFAGGFMVPGKERELKDSVLRARAKLVIRSAAVLPEPSLEVRVTLSGPAARRTPTAHVRALREGEPIEMILEGGLYAITVRDELGVLAAAGKSIGDGTVAEQVFTEFAVRRVPVRIRWDVPGVDVSWHLSNTMLVNKSYIPIETELVNLSLEPPVWTVPAGAYQVVLACPEGVAKTSFETPPDWDSDEPFEVTFGPGDWKPAAGTGNK